MIALLVALACADASAPAAAPASTAPAASTAAPTSRGVVLRVESDGLLVQHDDTLGRLTPGVDHYGVRDATVLVGVDPGELVELWLVDVQGGRAAERVVVKGAPGLPTGFDPKGAPLAGTVVRVDGGTLTLDHEPIPGVMGAMVMPFRVGARAASFAPGDRVAATLLTTKYGYAVGDLTKTGAGDAALRAGDAITVGQVLPRFEVTAEDGAAVVVGAGQDRPTALTFIYTRCPDPNFCPAVVSRMAALQARIGDDARIVTVTLDPEFDTPKVLDFYADAVGADPATWRMGHLAPMDLNRLAMASGLAVTVKDGRIAHLLRLLVLDGEGRLVERYDDNAWPLDRVVQQLLTGVPAATETGTLSAPATEPR